MHTAAARMIWKFLEVFYSCFCERIRAFGLIRNGWMGVNEENNMWKIVTDKMYKNRELIFPTQKADVGTLVEMFSAYPEILWKRKVSLPVLYVQKKNVEKIVHY